MFLLIITMYKYVSVTYVEIRTSGVCPYLPRTCPFTLSRDSRTSAWLTKRISGASVLAPQMVWSPLDNDLFECTVNWFLIMTKFKYLNAIFSWVNEHTLAVICAWGSLVKLLLNNDISKKNTPPIKYKVREGIRRQAFFWSQECAKHVNICSESVLLQSFSDRQTHGHDVRKIHTRTGRNPFSTVHW